MRFANYTSLTHLPATPMMLREGTVVAIDILHWRRHEGLSRCDSSLKVIERVRKLIVNRYYRGPERLQIVLGLH